jgi:4-amino-4-deoxy-L-arabinose transferase-like glycosyltransferase
VMILNVLTLVALVAFVFRVVSTREREPWLYAAALVAVNPVAILFSRKLWIECLLAPFALAMLFAWWRRRTPGGAFAWGVLGLWLGQIHMTGFFLAPALVLWTALFDRRSVRWRWWVAGCAVGAVPLIPWLVHLLSSHSAGAHNLSGILGSDGNFWYFWLATPIGRPILTSFGGEAAKLLAWPRVAGAPLHLVGLAEDVSIVAAVVIFAKAVGAWVEGRRSAGTRNEQVGRSDTTLAVSAATVGFGILLTASGVVIWRHYVTVAFILPFLLLALAGVRAGRLGRRLLTLIIIAQAAISVGYLNYIHTNGGAPGGDYGYAYDSPGNAYH